MRQDQDKNEEPIKSAKKKQKTGRAHGASNFRADGGGGGVVRKMHPPPQHSAGHSAADRATKSHVLETDVKM